LSLSPEKITALEALFQDASVEAPGCAVGVIENGEVCFARGYGLASLEHGVPITPATRFYMASVSKQVAALAVLLAAESGRLDLDDSIRKTMPELPAYMDGVSVRHLLAHTGGVRDYFVLGFLAGLSAEHPYSEADVLDIVSRQRALNFAPGAEFAYSNSGYVLLSIAIARATGQRLDDFAREAIFAPLGMRASRFQHDHTAIVPDKAFGYARRGDQWGVANSMLDVVADGGLYASLEDMLAWAANLLAPRIGASAIALMGTPATLNSGASTGYGMGLFVTRHRGLAVLEHSGGHGGYRTQLQVYPSEGFGVVVLCNDAAGQPQQIARQVAEACLEDRMAPPAARAPAPAPEALQARAGCYRTAVGDVLALVEQEGKLFIHGVPLALQALGDDSFAMAGDPDILRLAFDAESGFALTLGSAAPRRFTRCEPPAEGDEGAFLGEFRSAEMGAACVVHRDGDSLAVSFGRGPAAALRQISPGCLWAADLGVTLAYQRSGSGEVEGFTAAGGRVRGVAYRRV